MDHELLMRNTRKITQLENRQQVNVSNNSMWEKRGGQNFTHIVTSFSMLPAHMEISITIDMRVPV